MRKLTFTNSRGESVTLGNSRPFLVTKMEGTGPVTIQSQKSPYQDGTTYIDTLLEPRRITLEGAIMAHVGEEIFANRRVLSSVFNPKLGPGTLRYEYDGGAKEIQATADSAVFFPDRSGVPTQKFLATLLCPEPFWLDTFVTGREMSYLAGGLSFPLRLGTNFSNRGFQMNFINSGDVSTPINFKFFGPAENPTVTNVTTGEFVRVKRELQEGDYLEVDTTFGNKRVEIVREDGSRENAFHFIDLASTFFSLVPGVNKLEYSSSDDSTRAKVQITYRNRYVGI
ncbi:phage tail family protein [Brevibacillus agri]|uniref:phage tail family protein n=1 Tax=Brevibacillus agri TaxID=51101 RepID=UPI002E1A9945|nr:phage tail family protein [Brevibacillus agri]MED1652604.1 phage tail family protein [Brevibacillus agri]MED1689642.1 phage tail family protein [Brevibacillus agri]MED1691120.1 phage tail family protein [Brevibacillus agri]MED1696770.1 phage tail family protein [Brevibacillus agri]